MNFKDFLLNEGKAYFGQRVGDVLNAISDLEENGKSMGTRQLLRNSEAVVNQIRRILHTNWPKSEENNLNILQKVGVALARTLDPKTEKAEKDDIFSVISSAKSELEKISEKLGVPANKKSEEAPEETPQQPPEPPEQPPEPPEQSQATEQPPMQPAAPE